MKKSIIIYGSQYGTTKRYADRFSEITGIETVSYQESKDIDRYDRIIFMGALYAGSVLGLKKTISKMSPKQELVIVTVGLVDPIDPENIDYIRHSIKERIPADLYDETRIFHLRGAIDYSQLSLKHRMMMAVIHSKLSKMPEEKLNAEAKTILATYGKKEDFVDFKSLEKLGSVIQ
jgi:menaquinone-dependent protoporphyrinogen IX oxidase